MSPQQETQLRRYERATTSGVYLFTAAGAWVGMVGSVGLWALVPAAVTGMLGWNEVFKARKVAFGDAAARIDSGEKSA